MNTEYQGTQLFQGRGQAPNRDKYRRYQKVQWKAADGSGRILEGVCLSFRLDGMLVGVQRIDPATRQPAWVWSYGEYVPDNEIHIVPYKAILEPNQEGDSK